MVKTPEGWSRRVTRAVLLIAFYLPLALCTYLAVTPQPPEVVFRAGDVALHGSAFSYLTFALAMAYRSQGPLALAGWMLGYGLSIEIVQGLGGVRDAELKDLMVDLAGIGVGLLLALVAAEPCRRLLHRLISRIGGLVTGQGR